LEAAINIVEERAGDLEIRSKLFSFGQYKAGDQEEMLHTLFKKVSEVYSKCIGGNDANLGTLQMLTAIENRLEELFETIESLPPEKVGAAEKSKEKERRMRLREEKLEEQKLYQEDRMRRALERAQADPKKRNGKKLVFRSNPPVQKRKHRAASDKKNKDEEEMQYFFS
jgi:pyruvate/2-oxoacid:ferredoxin oxidoreductase beta subunit